MRGNAIEAERWLPPLAVGVVAVAVRAPAVYGRPFWEDEVASARIVAEPTFLGMLHRVAVTESTPPLWYALAWLVHQAGAPLQSERLISTLFGGLLAAAVMLLARRLFPLPLAVAAALTTALGTEFVAHGAELRAYELFAFLSVALGLSLVRLLEHPSRSRDALLAATVAAGCLTHYFFAFSAFAALVWLWLDPGARTIRRRGMTAIAAGGGLAAAWLPLMLTQYHNGRFRWIGPFRLRIVVAVPLRLFSDAYTTLPVGPILSVAAVALCAVGAVRLARTSQGRLVAMLAAVPLVLAAAVWAAGKPIFDLRNMIGIGAYVALLPAAALVRLAPRLHVAAAAAIVAAVAASLVNSNAAHIPPYDRMARALVRSGWNVSRPIAVFGDPYRYRSPLEWYLPRRPVLEMSRSLDASCATVFALLPGGRIEREPLRAGVPPHMTLLVDPAHRPRCVALGRFRA